MNVHTEKFSGADLLVKAIADAGTEFLFGYPGGAVLPIYDALYQVKPTFKHILCRHEQGLIHAAEGYARVTGKPGVVLSTSGPGGTNLITGITDAMMDSLPMVVFTGQVSAGVIGTDAFQEADMIGLTTPITKHNYQLETAKEIPQVVRAAFHIATTGRKGPVVIDVPKSVSEELVTMEEVFKGDVPLPGYQPTTSPNPNQIKRLIKALEEAEQPVILAGAGVSFAQAHAELIEFVERYQIPVVNTLQGLGSIPGKHELSLGMGGMHGNYTANMAIAKADLLINIGSRFDDRLTGAVNKFAPNAVVAHIDIDPAEVGKNIETDIPIVADAKEALRSLLNAEIKKPATKAWVDKCIERRTAHPYWFEEIEDEIPPQYLIQEIAAANDDEAVYVTDVGQHQMWVGQFVNMPQPNKLVTSGGLGTMGFGLPAAIGAQLGQPQSVVWAILGDGGIQMSIQELAVFVEYGLPVKIVIVNNGALGMVRQWQELLYDERYSESLLTQGRNPDFIKIAEGYGMKGIQIDKIDQVHGMIEEAMNHDGPVLIDARVTHKAKVYPMVPAGKGNDEMLGVLPPWKE